jgi:hypothetical protein
MTAHLRVLAAEGTGCPSHTRHPHRTVVDHKTLSELVERALRLYLPRTTLWARTIKRLCRSRRRLEGDLAGDIELVQ